MWKTNFDKDDISQKIPRRLFSPIKELESNMKEEKSYKDDDTPEGEEDIEVTVILRF